jgi:hypothetical protein
MKSWTCIDHGEFQSPISVCPTCNKRAKRNGLKEIIDSGTAPTVTRASFKKTNELLDTTLRNQNLTNYTNATGVPKATFSNEFHHDSGLTTGYGKEFLQKISGGAPMAALDVERISEWDRNTGEAPHLAPVDLNKYDNLVATVEAGGRIGSSGHIRERTNVVAKDRGEYR